MRVYTRGENQSLAIGDDVIVTVLQVFPDHIRVGITAPDREHDGNGRGDDESESNASSRCKPRCCKPRYWETDLYLPENLNLEGMELELSFQ